MKVMQMHDNCENLKKVIQKDITKKVKVTWNPNAQRKSVINIPVFVLADFPPCVHLPTCAHTQHTFK